MPHDDDFHVEPVRGLPERPPEGEHVLWQGRPQAWALAKSALNAHWIMGYFLAFGIWRGTRIGAAEGAVAGIAAASWYLAIGAICVGVLALMAWVMARETCYTLTNRRVAMRIGAALTVTLQLPYQWIASANLAKDRHGLGTITLELKPDTPRLSLFMLWPHSRPFVFARPQPALRCIPDAEAVAAVLGAAARTRIAEVEGAQALEPAAMPHPIAAE